MSQMAVAVRPLVLCCAALLAAACTRVVGGAAVPAFGAGPNLSGVDVDRVLLDQNRMRAITGADEHLTIIPSMDGKSPVDVDTLAKTAPPQCRFVYADTATFGPDIEEFHKTTFQYPPRGGLISEGAAAYRDRQYRTSCVRCPGGNRPGLREHLGRGGVRRPVDRRRTVAADSPRRLRTRLRSQVSGVGGGHLLRISGVGVDDRDHQHRRQRARLDPFKIRPPGTQGVDADGL